MEQSPTGEANRFSADQEFPRILWKPKVHYRIHKCQPSVLIMSQLDPIYISPHFVETEGSLPHSQVPATCPYHEPARSNLHLPAFCGNRRFITAFTSASHLSLSWASSIQSTFHRILWKPKVHYRIHKCQPTVLIMSQLDPIYISKSHFLKIYPNIIFIFITVQYCQFFKLQQTNQLHTM